MGSLPAANISLERGPNRHWSATRRQRANCESVRRGGEVRRNFEAENLGRAMHLQQTKAHPYHQSRHWTESEGKGVLVGRLGNLDKNNSIEANLRPQPCLKDGREWSASPERIRARSGGLHVSRALATKADDFELGLLPLLLRFHVLHNRCEHR